MLVFDVAILWGGSLGVCLLILCGLGLWYLCFGVATRVICSRWTVGRMGFVGWLA